MASDSVRKPTLPKVSIGLGNILAQSHVVADAFGPERGFKLMVIALVGWFVVSGIAVVLAARGVTRAFGW